MFPEGSRDHANHTPLQGNEKERQMTDTSGRKCLELFGNYNRAGSWARTFSALLIGTGDWYSRRCNLTWKVKGTKCNRMYFQLAPSTPPTDATESGLWPTPNCVQRDRTEIAIKHREEGIPLYTRRDKAGTARQFSIVDYAVYKGLLPTPRTSDCNSPGEHGNGGQDLRTTVASQTGETSHKLNPQFVLEMMGFPPNWTELPFLNGGTNP